MENSELISKAISYAKKNATNSGLTVQDIACNAGFSMDYFNRIFMSHTGFSVMAYVNYIRLKQAAVLLRSTEKSVLDIALESGYDSHEGFTKAFKKKYDLTPSDYRNKMKNKLLSWGEMVDKSVAAQFIYENPVFQQVDILEAIDYLLEKGAKRYGYLCSQIQNMGFVIAAPDGEMEKGFICIGDDRRGGCYLKLVTDDFELLAKWLHTFSIVSDFYVASNPVETKEALERYGFEGELEATPLAIYVEDAKATDLSKSLEIRMLTAADREFVLKWAGKRRDGYIKHLLNERHYLDEAVLEYGVFKNGELIAVVECGIEYVQAFKLNDSCRIRFAEGEDSDELYREIYSFVVNDVLRQDILPYDNLQFGEYAKRHGNFTAVDMGFEIVGWSYRLALSKNPVDDF